LGRRTPGIEKLIGVITYGNVPGVACRDSLLSLRHFSNPAILSGLEEIYGENVIPLRAVEKWTAAFHGGRTDLVDWLRSETPRDTGEFALRALIEGEGYLSQANTAQMLDIHYETVKVILRYDLSMRRVNFKWVPHELNISQKAVRVQFAEGEVISWKAVQTEVCKIYTLEVKHRCTWIIPRHPCGSVPMLGGRHTVASKKRMF
jgi:hypothetical protein